MAKVKVQSLGRGRTGVLKKCVFRDRLNVYRVSVKIAEGSFSGWVKLWTSPGDGHWSRCCGRY